MGWYRVEFETADGRRCWMRSYAPASGLSRAVVPERARRTATNRPVAGHAFDALGAEMHRSVWRRWRSASLRHNERRNDARLAWWRSSPP
jgi:hypothetical protein